MQLQNFYAFMPLLPDEALKEQLHAKAKSLNILGTILLAREGINAALCAEDENLRRFMLFLEDILQAEFTPFITDLKNSVSPFRKFKVRIKSEIVALGMPELNPGSASCPVGTYADPWEWNNLLSDPGVVVLDMRNTYEYCVGHFKNAVDPHTHVFKEFPAYTMRTWGVSSQKDIRIAMYCTGGIRCEKASAFLKSQRFSAVYQLRGGILEYFKVVPKEQSLWTGGCFVFDDRVVIDCSMNPLPVSFESDDIPQALKEYKDSSGHASHIYKKIMQRCGQ